MVQELLKFVLASCEPINFDQLSNTILHIGMSASFFPERRPCYYSAARNRSPQGSKVAL
jgi:hypothetical protein